MHKTKPLVAAAAVFAAAATALTPAAQAAPMSESMISVAASDSTPASGQQFRIHGRLVMAGMPAADHIVRVQARHNSSWVPLSGARMNTNDEGRYRMRLVLSQKGERLLRVVGVGYKGERNQHQTFILRVH